MTEETSDAYETDQQLKESMSHLDYGNSPAVAAFAQKLSHGASSPAIWEDLPEEILPQFLHAIGACGICALIEISLKSGKVDADGMKGIAALSIIRHNVLLRNASAVA